MPTNCAPSRATSSRASRFSRRTRNPATASPTGLSSEAALGAGPGSPIVSKPPASAAAAITANTVPTSATPSRTPAAAGAVRTLTLSIHPETTFAAVSSSAVRANAGMRADCAGRVSVTEVAADAASA